MPSYLSVRRFRPAAAAISLLTLFSVFSALYVSPIRAAATTLLSDDFTGTTIDTGKWTEVDATGVGGTTGHVQQNGSLSLTGTGTWGGNYLDSVSTFDRTLGDVTLDADMTCTGSSVPGIGYGDPKVLSGGTDSYTVYIVSHLVYLSRQHANANAENVSTAFNCTDNTPFHITLVIASTTGASLFINGSSTPSAVVTGGTFNNTGFFLEAQNGTTVLDNVSITGANSASVPDAPTSVIATPASGQMTLQWTAPGSNGGAALTDYVVEYKTSAGSTWTTFSDGVSTAASAIVTGLTNATSYDFRVSAKNSVGTSTPSSVVTATPALSVPSAPQSLAGSSGIGQVALTWTAPLSDGGAALTDYVVEYKTSAGSTWTTFSDGVSTAASAIVTGLTNATSYDFRVSAKNSVGTSTPSSVVTVTPQYATLSDSFTGTAIDTDKWAETDSGGLGGTAGKVQQNGSLLITPSASGWSSQAGISTVSTYDRSNGDVSMQVSVSRDTCGSGVGTVAFGYGDFDFTTSGSSSYILLSNATNWELYYWTNGSNVTGSGSSASPQTVSGLTSCTNGVPITFKLVALQGGGASVFVNGSSTPSATLTAGTFTDKGFWIGGYQSGGTVSYDNVSIIEPLAGPFPPTGLSATAGDGQVSLAWTAGGDNGAAITDYGIEYKAAATSTWSTFTDGVSTALSAVVTGLANGTNYAFRISGVNTNGTSTPSSTASATPFSSTPAAPTASAVTISGTAAEGELLSGSYTFSDANGDSEAASQYRWLRADTAGGIYSAIPGATSRTYTVAADDLGKYLKFEVTPVSAASPTSGGAVQSAATAQVDHVNFLNQIISTGQSLSVGVMGSPALSTTQPYDNVMLSGAGGGMGTGTTFTPLVESSVETMGSSLANSITANSPDQGYAIALTNEGVSGYAYSQLKKGTAPYASGLNQITNVKNAAALAGEQSRVVAVTSIHGETDNYNGVDGPTYEGYLVEWQHDLQSDAEAITGQSGTIPFFTDQMSSSFASYAYKATSTIPIYQMAASEDHPGTFYMVTPKYFFNYADRHHLTNASYRWLGEYYGKVMKKVLLDHVAWRPLTPDSVVRSSNVIYAKFHVPAGHLVFDTTIEQPKDNYGFEYADDASSATISSVEIINDDTVKVTLSNTPTGANQHLRYAYTGTVGVNAGSHSLGASGGNLRDTDTYPSLYGNTLYDWSVIFDKAITNDIVAPVLSAITSSGSSSSARSIAWTTDEPADTSLEYGLSASYTASTTRDASLATTHSVALSGLAACTTYHYRTISADLALNEASSADKTFTTPGCPGSASVTSATSTAVDASSGKTFNFTGTGSGAKTLSISVPAHFASTTGSATFQAQELDPATFFGTVSVPSGQSKIGNYVTSIKAYVDATTTLSSFDQPITLTFAYDPADLSGIDASSLKIYRHDDGTGWTALSNCTIDATAHTVSCDTSNFSDFALFGAAQAGTGSLSNSSGNMQSSFHGGTSIQSQVANLLALGDTARAAQLKAQWPNLFASTTTADASPASSPVFTFTRDLQLGDSGADVQELQRYLNAHGYPVAASGRGSAGSETSLFGPATQRALIDFQLAKQVAPAAGYFGSKTRAALGAPTGQPAVSAATTSSVAASASYARDLDVGSTGDDVRALQAYLNGHGFPVASSGPGSLGNETRVFGLATQRALKNYQQAMGIIPAAGYFGLKTRAYILAHP